MTKTQQTALDNTDLQTITEIITETYVSRTMCSPEFAVQMADRIVRNAERERADADSTDASVEHEVKMTLWDAFTGGGVAENVASKIMKQTSL